MDAIITCIWTRATSMTSMLSNHNCEPRRCEECLSKCERGSLRHRRTWQHVPTQCIHKPSGMTMAGMGRGISEVRESLELKHRNEYVAIEPESKSHFLGKTFLEAALAAKNAFPDRKSFVVRIGHEAAFHIGASTP